MSRMLSKMNLISVVQQLPKEDIETIQGYVEMIEEENQELKTEKEQLNILVNSCQEEIRRLKRQLEEYKDKINWYENFEVNKTIDKLRLKHNAQQKEFIDYLENEKDRLIHETSHYYTDSFDRQHAVNEDMYDEVDKISIKFKEIIGGKDER